MQEQNQLIDSPFESPRTSRRHNLRDLLDFGMNALLIGAILLCLLSSIVESGALFIAAVLFFFLGIYQFISAIIGAANGNTKKSRYLVAISIYILLLFLGFTLGDAMGTSGDSSFLLAMLALFVLPALGALYYLSLCYQALKPENSRYD